MGSRTREASPIKCESSESSGGEDGDLTPKSKRIKELETALKRRDRGKGKVDEAKEGLKGEQANKAPPVHVDHGRERREDGPSGAYAPPHVSYYNYYLDPRATDWGGALTTPVFPHHNPHHRMGPVGPGGQQRLDYPPPGRHFYPPPGHYPS